MLDTLTSDRMVEEARKYYDEQLKTLLEPARNGDYVAVDLTKRRHAVSSDPVAAYEELDSQGCSPPYVLLRVGSPWTFEGFPG